MTFGQWVSMFLQKYEDMLCLCVGAVQLALSPSDISSAPCYLGLIGTYAHSLFRSVCVYLTGAPGGPGLAFTTALYSEPSLSCIT